MQILNISLGGGGSLVKTLGRWVTKNRLLFKLFLSALTLSMLLFTGLKFYGQSVNYSETRLLFDSEVYVEVHGWAARQVTTEVLNSMSQLDDKLNAYSDASEISRINMSAGLHPVEVSMATFEIVKKAIAVATLTDGAFDPTIGPIVQLWGISADGSHKPKPSGKQINETLHLVDYQRVILDEHTHSIFMTQAGMKLDLGAIAKGYAVEQGVKILRDKHIKSGLVSAGGNIYALGNKPNGEPWHIGIKNPHNNSNQLDYVELHDTAIDSSGDYEQFYVEGDQKYTHIFDPHTGYPATSVSGTSVLTDSPSMADALATAVFVLGVQSGLKIINNLPGTEGLIVSEDGDLYYSQGFEGRLKT